LPVLRYPQSYTLFLSVDESYAVFA
jgi:hypothetical protein